MRMKYAICTRSLSYMKQYFRYPTRALQNIVSHRNMSSVFKSKIFPPVHRTTCLVKKDCWVNEKDGQGKKTKEREGGRHV